MLIYKGHGKTFEIATKCNVLVLSAENLKLVTVLVTIKLSAIHTGKPIDATFAAIV